MAQFDSATNSVESDFARGDTKTSDRSIRALLAITGLCLLACGAIATFVVATDVATAALITAGLALLVFSYVGKYITRVKFNEFEFELRTTVAQLKEVKKEAAATVSRLEEISLTYKAQRETLPFGGKRDAKNEASVRDAMLTAWEEKWTPETIKTLDIDDEGNRIAILGAMKANPKLRDFDTILHVIAYPQHGFDQDRFMLLATEMLGTLDNNQRRRLRQVVDAERGPRGHIIRERVRWLTSERLLRLLDGLERDLGPQ